MASAMAGDVSGPVAMMTGPAGTSQHSPGSTVMRGFSRIRAVTRAEKPCRSTASAPPAGTRLASAARMMSESKRRISSLSRPQALESLSALSELEQTSSAKPSA